jgi:DNA helicase-2/ATP-dependent DNA helicase PcrA
MLPTIARPHHYIRDSRSVGQSKATHGLSDRFLADNGAPPLRALEYSLKFSEGALLVGHNVGFDLRLLRANCRRVGFCSETRDYGDTLEMAQRFVDTNDRSLEGLVRLFTISFEPTHRAMDDVNATAALLMKAAPLAHIPREHSQSVALASNVDRIDLKGEQVRVLTIHQPVLWLCRSWLG